MSRASPRVHFGRAFNGGHNARIRPASADIAVHVFDDLLIGGMRMLAQQRSGREDHARRAVTALKRFFIQKRLLDRTESASALQPFDGRNL
jgi:hypothetical protein